MREKGDEFGCAKDIVRFCRGVDPAQQVVHDVTALTSIEFKDLGEPENEGLRHVSG
jgi:hypothetical protein